MKTSQQFYFRYFRCALVHMQFLYPNLYHHGFVMCNSLRIRLGLCAVYNLTAVRTKYRLDIESMGSSKLK